MNSNVKHTKEEVLLQFKNLGLVILGTLILSFGCAVFVVPFDLVTGGVTGFSIVIDNILDIDPIHFPILGEIPLLI